MSRIVVVSNRVPELDQPNASPGGLAIGLLGALKKSGGIWFGWSGNVSETDRDVHKTQTGSVTYLTVDLNQSEYESYYKGVSNGLLWPLCHFVLGFVKYKRADFEGYLELNRRFAREIAKSIKEDDLIWVHDYHMIPLAYELRKLGIKNSIGFFLHVPFPSYSMMRSLPIANQLLSFLSEYDVVGLQTKSDLDNFQDACVRGLKAVSLSDRRIKIGGRVIRCEAYPIGVDYNGIRNDLNSQKNSEERAPNPVSRLGGKLIVGADRIDYSKGLRERFDAYQTFFKRYPSFIGKASMVQVATISRSDDPAYAELRCDLESQISRLNGMFGEIDWMPVHYVNSSLPHDELMSLFNYGDICTVTSLRDGMNLVAKEFVAAQDAVDPGVLVLSELAGAAEQLDGAIVINPYDSEEIVDALHRAMVMCMSERKERYQSMLRSVRENDINAWREAFLDALEHQAQVKSCQDTKGFQRVNNIAVAS